MPSHRTPPHPHRHPGYRSTPHRPRYNVTRARTHILGQGIRPRGTRAQYPAYAHGTHAPSHASLSIPHSISSGDYKFAGPPRRDPIGREPPVLPSPSVVPWALGKPLFGARARASPAGSEEEQKLRLERGVMVALGQVWRRGGGWGKGGVALGLDSMRGLSALRAILGPSIRTWVRTSRTSHTTLSGQRCCSSVIDARSYSISSLSREVGRAVMERTLILLLNVIHLIRRLRACVRRVICSCTCTHSNQASNGLECSLAFLTELRCIWYDTDPSRLRGMSTSQDSPCCN